MRASYCSPIRTSTGGARRSRPCRLAGVEGLEPPTPGFGDRCSSQLSYTPRRAALYSGRNRPRHLFVSSFSGFKEPFSRLRHIRVAALQQRVPPDLPTILGVLL